MMLTRTASAAASYTAEKQAAIDSFEAFFRGEAVPRWPLEVFLEASNLCNFRCAMCGPFSALNPNRHLALTEQQRGFFDVGLTERSLDRVLPHALYVHAFGYGEPTIHPDFSGLLTFISRYKVMIDFITNGMRLTAELCEQIVAERVANVVISFSGASKADYENVYIGGIYEDVLANIKRLADIRDRQRSAYPRITVNSIAFRHHIDALPHFIDLMAAHGVNVIEVKKLMDDVPAMAGHAAPLRGSIEGGILREARARALRHGVVLSTEQYEGQTASRGNDAPPLIPVTELKARAVDVVQSPVSHVPPDRGGAADRPVFSELPELHPLTAGHFGTNDSFYCLEPFKTFYVRKNGIVKPCCFAPDSTIALGSIFTDDAKTIWDGEAFDAVRTGITELRYPKAACEACIRRGSGPQRNVIRDQIRSYVEWFEASHGLQLRASAAADVVPGDFMAKLRSARTADQQAIDNVVNAIADNPFLSGDGLSDGPDVIVPIHDAFADVCACLASVAAQTRCPFRLVLIDDGSSDRRISALLDRIHRTSPRITVVSRRDNHGFVRTVNQGFQLSRSDDVVILNSDTVVSPRWLDKLLEVARSRPDVATVTPLTNNGTICSVPHPMQENELPTGYDVVGFAALVEHTSFELFPEAPTGVGFCMLITRRALERVGTFDEETFGDGYGEENDFCQRAIKAGFVNLIADHTFVFHRGRGSFGARGDALTDRNLARVRSRHPGYDQSVATFGAHHPLALFHERLQSSIAAGPASVGRPVRVLHVLHEGGGTEMHARDLAAMETSSIVSYVLRSDGRALRVEEFYRGRAGRTLRFPLRERVDARSPKPHQAYRDSFAAACWALDIDVIHVHHLLHNSVDIATVAAEAGVPYLMTLHDYHTICPSYTLLNPDGHECRACLRESEGKPDRPCTASNGSSTSLADYQSAMETFLRGAVQLFAPNVRARDIVTDCYPSLKGSIAVVEHGSKRDGSDWNIPRAARRSEDPLNVAIIGGLDVHKGSRVLRDLLRANRREQITFHLYGTTTDRALAVPPGTIHHVDGSRFVNHGRYNAAEITRKLKADGMHVGLQLSVWPETFSFTLSELVEAGIPVIGGRLGAQGERIERCRLGWTVPDIRDASAILTILHQLADQPQVLESAAAAMNADQALVPVATMWEQYAETYRELAHGPERPGAARGKDRKTRMNVSRTYVAFLATQAEAGGAAQLQAEVDALRERLRSPRHRIADTMANALQRVPVVWPIVARITDGVLKRNARLPRSH